MFKILLCVGLIIQLATGANINAQRHHSSLSNEFIEEINNKQTKWTAGRNFPENLSRDFIKRLTGVQLDVPTRLANITIKKLNSNFNGTLPVNFDSRETWPNCPTIQHIRDQGSCSLGWALSVVEVIEDRLCIASKHKFQEQLSAYPFVACTLLFNGCNGNKPNKAWFYAREIGLTTGGDYNSNKGCQPFPVAPCEHYVNGSRPTCSNVFQPLKCILNCTNSMYDKPFENDLHRIDYFYAIDENEEAIKQQIFQYGPVQSLFNIFEDVLHYKSGVYSYSNVGDFVGIQAVKIIGWGVENNSPYWLVANSWNSDWGDNGFIKILRGVNECGIEHHVTAGDIYYNR